MHHQEKGITWTNKQSEMTAKEIMNRRDFIQSSSILAASVLSMPTFATAPASKYKMGLQLFTVRAPLANDVMGTVKTISSIGYEDCETYGYDPDLNTYYGLKASAFKQLLADNKMI